MNIQHLLLFFNHSIGWIKKKVEREKKMFIVCLKSLYSCIVFYIYVIIYAHNGLSPLWHSSSPVRREIISHWWLLHLTYPSTSEKINANREIKPFVFFSRGERIYHWHIGIHLDRIQMIPGNEGILIACRQCLCFECSFIFYVLFSV